MTANPFLFLNDLALAPNGDVYLTDSGIEVEDFGARRPAQPGLPHAAATTGACFRIDAADARRRVRRPRAAVHQRDRVRAGPATCMSRRR